MENSKKENEELSNEELNRTQTPNPIETDYEKNKESPGPAREAVTEKNDEKAGRMMHIILPIIIIVLIIFFWLINKRVF